jgi:SAM-dependent methyltransferase
MGSGGVERSGWYFARSISFGRQWLLHPSRKGSRWITPWACRVILGGGNYGEQEGQSAVTSAVPSTAAERWNDRVRRHNEQTRHARGATPEHADMWSALAGNFRADPRRTNDAVVNFLAQFAGPQKTVLDVGGGAGRYALPLALQCKHVTVVEPSPSMTDVLKEAAREAAIENVSAIAALWEEADVEPADILLCANVVNATGSPTSLPLSLAAERPRAGARCRRRVYGRADVDAIAAPGRR